MSDRSLELLSAAFADFMTPEEDGSPVLLRSDLKHALEAVGIPPGLATDLQPLMDPQNTGKITFEEFVQVCQGELEHETSDNDSAEYNGGDYDGGDDDDDDDEDYVEETHESRSDAKRKHVYDMLSNKKGRITPRSLEKVASKLKLDVSESDLQRMAKMAPDEGSFDDIWDHLAAGR